MKFEGVRIFRIPLRRFKSGAAITIPGVGIFVGKGWENDVELLRHEFGHVLQFRKWGFVHFWKNVAPDSLRSAHRAEKRFSNHMETWTEWSANRLAFEYFNKPGDWSFHRFPINPFDENMGKPKFAANNPEFIRDWLNG